ncbi:hypothetical protein JST56_05885 [Candidatus Dependentiae bacterium]|nr:hypothetical protein [Candidatus Dependentiae bacterium]
MKFFLRLFLYVLIYFLSGFKAVRAMQGSGIEIVECLASGNNSNNNNNNNNNSSGKRSRKKAEVDLTQTRTKSKKETASQTPFVNNSSDNKYGNRYDESIGLEDDRRHNLVSYHVETVLPWAKNLANLFEQDQDVEVITASIFATFLTLSSFMIEDSLHLPSYFKNMCDHFFNMKDKEKLLALISDFNKIRRAESCDHFYQNLLKVCAIKLNTVFPELTVNQYADYLQRICNKLPGNGSSINGMSLIVNPQRVFLVNSDAKLRQDQIEAFVMNVLLQIVHAKEDVQGFWEAIHSRCFEIFDIEKLKLEKEKISDEDFKKFIEGFINSFQAIRDKSSSVDRMDISYILN